MANPAKPAFLDELTRRFGVPRRLEHSSSLYEIADGKVRLYLRYSKKHPGNRTFFGLRKIDLEALEGHCGFLCFLWDGQKEPLFVPLTEFSDVFAAISPANDGQYKAQIYEDRDGTELYIANAGRFGVDAHIGWSSLDAQIGDAHTPVPALTHSQVQTLLGGIGAAKGFDVWVPVSDRKGLDWSLTPMFCFPEALPPALESIKKVAEEIDVAWLERGAGHPAALFEVEHSTPIYSGLLRFNDVHLTLPDPKMRFGIVSNDERRAVFVRQLARPTFRVSGLGQVCTFLEYRNVFAWHKRMRSGDQDHERTT